MLINSMYEPKEGLLVPVQVRLSTGKQLTKDQTSPRLRPTRSQPHPFDRIQFYLEMPVGAVLYRDDPCSFHVRSRYETAPASC